MRDLFRKKASFSIRTPEPCLCVNRLLASCDQFEDGAKMDTALHSPFPSGIVAAGRSVEVMSNWQNIYLSSQGRFARLPYFGYSGAALVVLYFVAAFILTLVLGAAGLLVAIVVYLALVFPSFNLMAKRLQDFGKPGKWAWGVIAIGVLGALLPLSDLSPPSANCSACCNCCWRCLSCCCPVPRVRMNTARSLPEI